MAQKTKEEKGDQTSHYHKKKLLAAKRMEEHVRDKAEKEDVHVLRESHRKGKPCWQRWKGVR